MFDLITGRETHLPSHPTAPILLSTFAQATLIAVIALIPVLFVSERLPEVPGMLVFVAVPPAPPPPPPPPVATKARPTPPKAETTRVNQLVAPLEEPARIDALPNDEGVDFGVPGGVRQWRYSPVVLNGVRVPFILTVTLSFHVEAPK
jgi:hypothetical protein